MSRLFLKYWKSLLFVNLLFYLLVIRYGYHHLYSENALLENFQGVLRLFEELAEINAYLFLALPALYELYYGFKKSLHLRAGGNLGVKAEET